MTLPPGTALTTYEIVGHLGSGGMGEVYEARVLASLNHPNMATLYGFEEDGPTHFLVMELVDGDTLGDEIARGPMSVDDA